MRTPLFIHKYTQYEYWPMWLFYLPVLPYWLYLAAKHRSLTYFTVANPGIDLGGFFGESKSDILKLIHPHYLPKAIIVDKLSADATIALLLINNMNYPLIAKPDVGERGNDVCKINNETELKQYHTTTLLKYILQEFVSYDIELGILYSRLPNDSNGRVTSVTLKEFLTVTGNGTLTIKQLMQQSVRARFQIKRLSLSMGKAINEVLPKGTIKLLEPIGNHCRGTRFINANYLINDELNAVFDKISIPITGFNYGRFDLKVKSIADLYAGNTIKIMELNGASSEPGHIYDASQVTLLMAYKDLCKHWKRLANVSLQHINAGLKPVPFSTVIKSYLTFARK
jgi:hypothetical protein